MTARQALNAARTRLLEAGREDGGRIAMLLLEESMGVSYALLIAAMDTELDEGASVRFETMVDRATRGEPAQYIIGYWEFCGRRFRTDRRALIPRPETELLAEAAVAAMPPGMTLSVMDAGCGTGCIGITVKLERPQACVTLSDISREALALARENADSLGAGVQLAEADMRLPFPGGPYDVIVSNPPYIDAEGMAAISKVVREHEPHAALFGGPDGLDFVRSLALRAQDSLKPGGRMFVEIGHNQADRAIGLFSDSGMDAAARPDYAGIPRIIAVRKGY